MPVSTLSASVELMHIASWVITGHLRPVLPQKTAMAATFTGLNYWLTQGTVRTVRKEYDLENKSSDADSGMRNDHSQSIKHTVLALNLALCRLSKH